MKTAVGLSFFDNAKEIPRCLGSLEDKSAICNNVDYIIGINGRYDGYNADHNYSVDGSDDILATYPNSVQAKFHGYQTDKRQRYLDIAGELKCDYLIVVDTDEYVGLWNDWKTFYRNLEKASTANPHHKLFNMYIWLDKRWEKAHNSVNTNEFRKYTRIHKEPGSQRYCCHTHYYWCDKAVTDEQLMTGTGTMLNPLNQPIDGVRLATDSTLRNAQTLNLRDRWAWNTVHEENKRQYILRAKYHYKDLKNVPKITKMGEYDKQGRPIIA